MNIISVKELRINFDRVRQAVAQGESLLLVYRSKPIAQISPPDITESKATKKERITKNLAKINRLAGGLKLGKKITPKDLNKLYDQIYG